MNEYREQNIKNVKSTVDVVLGIDTKIKRKKKTKQDQRKILFHKIINGLESLDTRTILLQKEFEIDFFKYDSQFYDVMDSLIEFHFGKKSSEIIYFYVYERINSDGSLNAIKDNNGNIIPLENVEDLWELLELIKELK